MTESTPDDANTDADQTATTATTTREPGIGQVERDEFDSPAEQEASVHDYASQAREADAGGDPRIM